MKLSRRNRWKRIYLTLVSFSLLTPVSLFEGHAKPKQQSRDEKTDRLRVTIAADKTKIRSGETLTLRVEIYNQGTKSVYVATNFDGPDNAFSRLSMSLFHDGSLVDSGGQSSAGDYGRYRPEDTKKPPFANEFSKYWLVLRPGYSYGGQVVLDPATFQTLHNPGKYEIRGTYRSSGFMGSGMNNPLAGYMDELSQLPFQAWVGEVESNKVWVEVIERAR